MAAIDFPWDLATVFLEDMGLGREPDTRRTPFEDGAIAEHKFTTRAFKLRTVRIAVTQANLAAFNSWLDLNGNRMFNFTDLEDGQTRDVKIRGGAGSVNLRYVRDRRLQGERYFQATVELEGFV